MSDEIIARHQGMRGALLPILHAMQAEAGHVSDAALGWEGVTAAFAAARQLA